MLGAATPKSVQGATPPPASVLLPEGKKCAWGAGGDGRDTKGGTQNNRTQTNVREVPVFGGFETQRCRPQPRFAGCSKSSEARIKARACSETCRMLAIPPPPPLCDVLARPLSASVVELSMLGKPSLLRATASMLAHSQSHLCAGAHVEAISSRAAAAGLSPLAGRDTLAARRFRCSRAG